MRPRPISARQNPAARRPPPALASPHLTLQETQRHKFRAKNYFGKNFVNKMLFCLIQSIMFQFFVSCDKLFLSIDIDKLLI